MAEQIDIPLLQAYVDAALAELGVRNHGPGRVKARPDRHDPAKAWVRVHGLAGELEFASHLLALVQRRKWGVVLNGSHRYVTVIPWYR